MCDYLSGDYGSFKFGLLDRIGQMQIKQIYHPVEKEVMGMEEVIGASLSKSRNAPIQEVSRHLLCSGGKRLRPALVILSAKASLGHQPSASSHQLTKIASAIELIHMASLVHDDVIDHASLRHNKPTINSKWGQDVAIAAGDYLYSEAFRLIAECGNSDILSCVSEATKLMCEGELQQVCERDNLDLLKRQYLMMIKKKTASLFAASCQAGAISVNSNKIIETALKEYGLNFGIAFQITDDCLDLIGKKEALGKSPGADFKMGELTLPVLNLISENREKNRIISLIGQSDKRKAFKEIRQRFINSEAFTKTKEDVYYYIRRAKKSIDKLDETCFKKSLFALVDYVGSKAGDGDEVRAG